jgi:hypothetical protein
MRLLVAFTAGFLAGLTFSEWQFTRSVRRACAAVEAARRAQPSGAR